MLLIGTFTPSSMWLCGVKNPKMELISKSIFASIIILILLLIFFKRFFRL